jgi:hypothetical protein
MATIAPPIALVVFIFIVNFVVWTVPEARLSPGLATPPPGDILLKLTRSWWRLYLSHAPDDVKFQ